jgi:hypothetical protein
MGLHGDYCLSGRLWRGLAETAARVINLESVGRIKSVELLGPQQERELVPAAELSARDLATTHTMDVVLEIETFDSNLLLALSRGDENEPPNTIVDCMVYLDQLIDERPTAQTALRDFVDVMARFAEQLDCGWLHFACEDDARLQLGAGLLLPDICGIYRPEILQDIHGALVTAGAVIDSELVRGYRVVWVAPLDVLVAENARTEPSVLHDLLRKRLASGDV